MAHRLLREWKASDPLRAGVKRAFARFSVFSSSPMGASGMTPGVGVLSDEGARRHFHTRPIDRVPRAWIVSVILLAAVYIATCGVPRLFDQIDGQYAGAAREMMNRGDWLVPTQNGVPRLQKPPLVYWCEILSFNLFGTNEFAARLPVALAAVAWFAATGLVARRVVGTSSAGVAAAMALAAFAGTFFFGHLVMPEPFIGCFVTLAFWALLGAVQEQPSETARLDRWLLAAWFFIALGALAKGLHALVFPLVAISVTAGVKPSVRPVWRRFILKPHGWILFFVLLVPWYAVIERRYPGFLGDHFFNEQLGPALSRRWPPDSDRVPLSIFWLQHLVLFFPMTLLFPAAFWSAYRAYKSERKWPDAEPLLLLFWFLANALGISFANVQDYYLMAAWPPVAVGIAWAISKRKISLKWPALVLVSFGGLGLLTAFALAIWRSHQSDELLGGGAPTPVNQDTIMIVFQNLPPSAWTKIIPLLCATSGAALAAGVLVFVFDRRGKSHLGFAGFALFMATIFLLSTRGLAIVQDQFSSAKIAETINRIAESCSTVVVQGDSNEKTSLFFYLHQNIYWVDGHPDLEFATRRLDIGRNHYLDRATVAEKWRGPEQLFLIVQKSAVEDWRTFLNMKDRAHVVACVSGAQAILANH
jgi:4-amino-4-deoxy-L-arabinose transferase-like glycosyltransferase